MENAVEALKMAGAVLLFVIALSVAILAFTTARESMDKMIKYSDRESLTIENDSRFYYIANDNDVEDISKRNDKTRRYVGLETIIPSMYRSVTENFKIIFDFGDSGYYLYENKMGTKVNKIDWEKDKVATGNDKNTIRFLSGIIYGVPNSEETDLTTYKNDFMVNLPPRTECLYNSISNWLANGHKIREDLGTYYMEDVSIDGTPSGTPESNKIVKRVITYTFFN